MPNLKRTNSTIQKDKKELAKKEAAEARFKVGERTGEEFLGFKVLKDIERFSTKEEYIAPYSLPQEALSFEPDDATVIHVYQNGDTERKLHNTIRLKDDEVEKLDELRKLANEQDVAFPRSMIVMATRYISLGRGDVAKALACMQETVAWREEYFKEGPVTDTQVMEDMKHGIIYFAGRDKCLRPLIIVRANRIPQKWYKDGQTDRVLKLLIFCMEYMCRYMVVPGKIEGNCVLVDLKGLGVSQVPMGALKDIYGVMSHHYIGRVFKFYICNLSRMLGTLAGFVKAMLTDRQKQKLVFVDNLKELQEAFAAYQLEQDLGGTRPAISTFFPFPLLPGPFELTTKAHRQTAVRNCHRAFEASAFRGQLWDKDVSEVENLTVEYSPLAASIYESCGLPVPPGAKSVATKNAPPPEPTVVEPEVVGKDEEQLEAEKEARELGTEYKKNLEMGTPKGGDTAVNIVTPGMEEDSVKPGGLFSCGCCH